MITGIERVQARISVIERRLQALQGGNFESLLRSMVRRGEVRGSCGPGGVDLPGTVDAWKVERLQAYMRSRNFNPALAAEAESFVAAAAAYGMDWRLAPALAAVESSGGRECFRPYNPFGILGRDFGSFREAVYEVNRLVRSYGFGNDIRAVLAKYNPAGGEAYIRKVMHEMECM